MDNQTLNKPAEFATRTARGAPLDQARTTPRDEGAHLISSDRVEGTKVFAPDGEELGRIDALMIGKRSGRVEYTLMNFGGFLGINEKQFPIPWDALDYDEKREGYVVNIDKTRLRDAPTISDDGTADLDASFGRSVYAFYGAMY